jgi:hypothetical protein
VRIARWCQKGKAAASRKIAPAHRSQTEGGFVALLHPKQLRPLVAYALATIAGALIVRDFDVVQGSRRAGIVQADSTSASVSPHRLSRGPSGLPDLSPGLENLRLTEASIYQGTGRNIFRVEIQQSNRQEVSRRESMEQKFAPPVVPASFPLKFFGFSRNGKTSAIFLLKNNDIFIAREGEIVDRRYKIVRIAHNSAQVEDLLSDQRQELWLREMP